MKKLHKGIFIILAIAIFSLMMTACTPAAVTNNQDMSEEDIMEEKEMAYDFELLDLNGNTHKLSDYNGQKVYLKFWGTWCPICVSGLGELTELHEQYLDSDVMVISIIAPSISGEMSEEKFKEWYASQGYEFRVLLDPTAETFVEYGVRAFPSSAYINSDGSLHNFKIGHQQNISVIEEIAAMK